MKRLLILGFLFVGILNNQMVPIQRNQAWNDMVLEMQAQEPLLRVIEKFLKLNEQQVRAQVLDYRVIKSLDKAIDSNEKITKKLKEIKKALQ